MATTGVDNISLHVRGSDRANVSRIFGNLTLDLNSFSVATHERLVGRLEDSSFDHGGLRGALAHVVFKGDTDEPVVRYDLATPLNENKIRATVT
jgi:hypothetical protein